MSHPHSFADGVVCGADLGRLSVCTNVSSDRQEGGDAAETCHTDRSTLLRYNDCRLDTDSLSDFQMVDKDLDDQVN